MSPYGLPFKIVITALSVFGMLSTIYTANQPRQPQTNGEVVIITVVNALMIWGFWALL